MKNHDCTEGRWEEYEEKTIYLPAVGIAIGLIIVAIIPFSVWLVNIPPKSLVTLDLLCPMFLFGIYCLCFGSFLSDTFTTKETKQRWVRK
jgi:uncharacterized membrane protein